VLRLVLLALLLLVVLVLALVPLVLMLVLLLVPLVLALVPRVRHAFRVLRSIAIACRRVGVPLRVAVVAGLA